MLQEKIFKHKDINLNYAKGPKNGPPFLLLPAYDNRWQSYSSIIPRLAANTHLFALDTRGRGRSDRVPGKYNLIYSMKDTISFIEKVVEEACHIFGHSNGGWIGLWVAAKRPDLVNSLIVGDSGLDTAKLIEEGKSEEERAFNQRFMDWAGKPVEELVEIFSNRYSDSRVEYIETRALTFSQVDPRVYIDWVDGRLDKYFKGYQYEEILGSIKCPVLVLKAENGMISQEEVKRAQKINDEIMIKEMDGYDHWLGIQDGRESALLNEVINFLFPFT